MPRDRPRLWESFKRALGGPPPVNAPEPKVAARQRNLAPPFLAADEAVALPPATPPPVLAQTDPIVGTLEASARENEATAHEVREDPPTPLPPAPETAAPRSARLARGLASFSSDNADREKKYRHILSDGDAGGTKKR